MYLFLTAEKDVQVARKRGKPEGNLEGRGVQNPRPREISRAEGGVFSDTSRLEAVYGHSFIIIRELLILLLDNRWR